MSPKQRTIVWTAVAVVLLAGIAWVLVPGVRRFIRNDDLNEAARAGDLARVTELLNAGVDVNGSGMHGMMPIMAAAEGGHLKVVELLVARGADVNGHNGSGSALMWAVDSGNEEVVRFFLQRGVDAEWRNALGGSALKLAREQKKESMVRLLEGWGKER